MADGSMGSVEDIQKRVEQAGSVVELRPKLYLPEKEAVPSAAKEKRRDADVTIARREALRLQLGGSPTQRQLSSEQMRLNEQLGTLRAERSALKKEILKPDAERSEERALRLKKIETEMSAIEVRRADIGYWLSLGGTEGADVAADVENSPVGEVDALRRDRAALQRELDQTDAGVFSFFKRRRLESQIKEIDQRTRAIIDRQRGEESIAAK